MAIERCEFTGRLCAGTCTVSVLGSQEDPVVEVPFSGDAYEVFRRIFKLEGTHLLWQDQDRSSTTAPFERIFTVRFHGLGTTLPVHEPRTVLTVTLPVGQLASEVVRTLQEYI